MMIGKRKKMANKIPNWAHNSGKQKRTRGTCKGQIRARKQALQSLKKQLNVKWSFSIGWLYYSSA